MESAAFFLLVIPFVGFVVYLVWRAEQKRRERLHAFALSKGWTFHHRDPYALADRWWEPPFGEGHSRRASNVIEGVEAGRTFLSFEYVYKETSSSGQSRQDKKYHFHVTALQLPRALPDLYVGRESVLTRLGGAIGLGDIELESEDFNRRFRVQASSRKFAHDILHPRMMERLLSADCPAFRLEGGHAVMWCKGKATPESVLGQLAALGTFVDGVPAFVWKDHGYDPDTNNAQGGVV